MWFERIKGGWSRHGRTGRKKLGGQKEICPTFSDCAQPVPKKFFLEEKAAAPPDKGLINGVLFLDLRKPFDTVDHIILIEKLKLYGITENINVHTRGPWA